MLLYYIHLNFGFRIQHGSLRLGGGLLKWKFIHFGIPISGCSLVIQRGSKTCREIYSFCLKTVQKSLGNGPLKNRHLSSPMPGKVTNHKYDHNDIVQSVEVSMAMTLPLFKTFVLC